MASHSFFATLNFVKKYPITLCAFSLLFMPSVHRLLLYFTPLLLSTAIFIVAMLSWGPSAASGQSTTRRSKANLASKSQKWAFNESMGIAHDDDDDDDEEEAEEEAAEEEHVVALVSHRAKETMDLHEQDIIQKSKVEPDVGLKPREELEPDPDLSKECNNDIAIKAMCNANLQIALAKEDDAITKTTTSGANCQGAHHSPATSMSVKYQGAPLDNARMRATAAGACQASEPDPDLQGEDMGTPFKDGDVEFDVSDHSTCASNNGHAHCEEKSDEGDARGHDMSHSTHGHGHARSCASSHGGMSHVHNNGNGLASHTSHHQQHKHLQEGVSPERAHRCLQVCA